MYFLSQLFSCPYTLCVYFYGQSYSGVVIAVRLKYRAHHLKMVGSNPGQVKMLIAFFLGVMGSNFIIRTVRVHPLLWN